MSVRVESGGVVLCMHLFGNCPAQTPNFLLQKLNQVERKIGFYETKR